MHAELIERPERCQKDDHARGAEPRGLVVGRLDLEGNRRLQAVPSAVAVAGSDAKSVRARAQVGVNGFSCRNRLAPTGIEAIKKVSKAYPLGRCQTQARIGKCNLLSRSWNTNRVSNIDWIAICRNHLDVSDCRNCTIEKLRRINYGQSSAP